MDHIMQACYNSLYFSQMVYPDFDMFESISPNAELHAVSRALSDGPVYITDKVNEHNFKVLRPLVYSDGNILRPDKPLLPLKDCLFLPGSSEPFKAYTISGKTGVILTFNQSLKDSITGNFKPNQIPELKEKRFAVYEYFTKQFRVINSDEALSYKLYAKSPYKLFYIAPISNGNAVFGLINKYDAPAAVLNYETSLHKLKVELYEGGKFLAFVNKQPLSVKVNGKDHTFSFNKGLLTVDMNVNKTLKPVKIEINL